MITLNLTATTTEEKVLKEYLEENVSEILPASSELRTTQKVTNSKQIAIWHRQ